MIADSPLHLSEARVNDLDFLAARLHGRRSRLAEGERLSSLGRLPAFAELAQARYPEGGVGAPADFQRRLTQELVEELQGFLRHLEGAGAGLLAWLLVRFQVENIKILLRGHLRQFTQERITEHLVRLPLFLAVDLETLEAAESLETFIAALPLGTPRQSLRRAATRAAEPPPLFFLEGALDQGYFQELLARSDRFSGEDQAQVQPIILQEVDTFHLQLVLRGKYQYGLTPEVLLPLHVSRSRVPTELFRAMLSAPEPSAAANLAVGRVIDKLPTGRGSGEPTMNAAALEALAWARYLRLSNRAFRQSHVGLGTVIGYVGIRRVEVSNLVTLSEGLGGGAAETLLARLHPRVEWKSSYA